MHTGWKSRGGEGVLEVFAKIPRRGSRVSGKIARGGPPILRFIAFLLTSFSKICLGGAVSYLPPPLPPLCVSMVTDCWQQMMLASSGNKTTTDRKTTPLMWQPHRARPPSVMVKNVPECSKSYASFNFSHLRPESTCLNAFVQRYNLLFDERDKYSDKKFKIHI